MAGWWHLLGVYVVAGVFAGVIGWRLLKADAPPGVAYVTFASFARHPRGWSRGRRLAAERRHARPAETLLPT